MHTRNSTATTSKLDSTVFDSMRMVMWVVLLSGAFCNDHYLGSTKYRQGYQFVLISKICANFQGQCLRKRDCASF